jgi:hypothetical protein
MKLITTDQKTEIPLKNVVIDTNIYNHIAEYTLTQTYYNTSLTPIDVVYIFPTPANASVYDFLAKIGDKIDIDYIVDLIVDY